MKKIVIIAVIVVAVIGIVAFTVTQSQRNAVAVQTGTGIVELLPRYLDYKRKRTPTFARYLLLERRVYSDDFFHFESDRPISYWVDPASNQEKGAHLGLIFHTFVGEDDEAISLA